MALFVVSSGAIWAHDHDADHLRGNCNLCVHAGTSDLPVPVIELSVQWKREIAAPAASFVAPLRADTTDLPIRGPPTPQR